MIQKLVSALVKKTSVVGFVIDVLKMLSTEATRVLVRVELPPLSFLSF